MNLPPSATPKRPAPPQDRPQASSFPQDIGLFRTSHLLVDIASSLEDMVSEQLVVSNDIQHLARVSSELQRTEPFRHKR